MFLGILRLKLLVLSFLVPLVQSQLAVNKTVDDSYIFDSTQLDGIQYGPQWYHEYGDSNRKNSSLNTTITADSNLVYFFQGISLPPLCLTCSFHVFQVTPSTTMLIEISRTA
jgi:hypothetical protein